MRRVTVLLTLLAVAVTASAARADNTAGIKVTAEPPARADQGTWDVGSAQPTFDIQIDLSKEPGTQTVRCKFDNADEGPCTQQQPACPVSQCWTATAPAPQSGTGHELSVLLYDASGDLVDAAGLNYDIDTTPPDTGTPAVTDITERGAVTFGFPVTEDAEYPDTLQCSVTAPGATQPAATWFACGDGHPLKPPAKLRLRGTYRLWARAIDYLGRIDATPATTLFSPTACTVRVLHRPKTLRAIVRHGLRLRYACELDQGVSTQLMLSQGTVQRYGLPSPLLGSTGADVKAGTPKVVRLPTLRGVPRVLFGIRHLFVGLTSQVDTGPVPPVTELSLHR